MNGTYTDIASPNKISPRRTLTGTRFKEIATDALVDAVRITAVDFCAQADPPFDGSPFSSAPEWLLDALLHEDIKCYPADRDYALWKVNGETIAEPDDWIIRHADGTLSVSPYKVFEQTYESVGA